MDYRILRGIKRESGGYEMKYTIHNYGYDKSIVLITSIDFKESMNVKKEDLKDLRDRITQYLEAMK